MIPFPRLVSQLCTHHDAWVVGGAAKLGVDLEKVRDWDIAVPYRNWAQAAMLIPKEAVPNIFGGWKCPSHRLNSTGEPMLVDVWPDDIDRLLTNHLSRFLWHPRSDTRWSRTP